LSLSSQQQQLYAFGRAKSSNMSGTGHSHCLDGQNDAPLQSAERQIASLTRDRNHADRDKAPGADTDSFVVRQSIEHFHKLLDTGPLDEGGRRTVETLLGEAEAKLAKGR
jgi:hypothetical protein